MSSEYLPSSLEDEILFKMGSRVDPSLLQCEASSSNNSQRASLAITQTIDEELIGAYHQDLVKDKAAKDKIGERL
mgnify:CR=1 FL=1